MGTSIDRRAPRDLRGSAVRALDLEEKSKRIKEAAEHDKQN